MTSFLTQGQPITSFAVSNPQPVFETAISYPSFFNTHLVDPNRVIKILDNDPQANERVFYYQYLRICENYEDPTSQERIRNMKEFVTNEDLVFLFPPEHQQNPQVFCDAQFKRIIFQFMDVINQGELSVDQALSVYPIVDTVFTYLMRTLLIYNEKAADFTEYINRNQTFAYLSSIFDIELELFENCIKFRDADIFVYEEVPNEVYMAYVQIGSEQAESEEEPQQIEEPVHTVSEVKRNNQMYMSSNSIYEFVDFTHDDNQGKLTSTLKLSAEVANQIKEMNEEQAREDDEDNQYYDQDQELSGQLEMMDIKIPNQVEIPPLKPEADSLCSQVDEISQKVDESIQKLEQSIEKVEESIEKAQDFSENVEQFSQKIDQFSEKQVLEFENKEIQPVELETDHIRTQTSIQNMITKGQLISPIVSPSHEEQNKTQLTHQSLFEQTQQHTKPQIKFTQSKYEPQSYLKNIEKFPKLNMTLGSQRVDNERFPNILPSSFKKNTYPEERPSSKPPRLNVTLQFTSSFLMKKIAEPYRSNITKTKQRARQYRKSIQKAFI